MKTERTLLARGFDDQRCIAIKAEAYISNMAIDWLYQAVKAEKAEENAGAFLQRWSMAGPLCCWMGEKGEVSGLPENVEEGTLSWCFPSTCHSLLAQPPLFVP